MRSYYRTWTGAQCRAKRGWYDVTLNPAPDVNHHKERQKRELVAGWFQTKGGKKRTGTSNDHEWGGGERGTWKLGGMWKLQEGEREGKMFHLWEWLEGQCDTIAPPFQISFSCTLTLNCFTYKANASLPCWLHSSITSSAAKQIAIESHLIQSCYLYLSAPSVCVLSSPAPGKAPSTYSSASWFRSLMQILFFFHSKHSQLNPSPTPPPHTHTNTHTQHINELCHASLPHCVRILWSARDRVTVLWGSGPGLARSVFIQVVPCTPLRPEICCSSQIDFLFLSPPPPRKCPFTANIWSALLDRQKYKSII